tara:strand:- start:567 stop:743 length:177 start_codon:yes stop_codon:yes gene_type:complete
MEFSPLEITLLILAPMIIAFYVGFSKGEGVGVEKTINTFVRLNMVEEIDEEEFHDDEV